MQGRRALGSPVAAQIAPDAEKEKAIARSVVLGHGGSMELIDLKPPGLRVRIALPGTLIIA